MESKDRICLGPLEDWQVEYSRGRWRVSRLDRLGQTVDQTRNNPPGVISPTFTQGSNPEPIFALAPSGTYPFNFPLPPIPAGSLDAKGGLVGVASNVTALQRNIPAPLAVNYVVGVERQLPWSLVAGANYSGSRSYDGITGMDQNRCADCALRTAQARHNDQPAQY